MNLSLLACRENKGALVMRGNGDRVQDKEVLVQDNEVLICLFLEV